MTIVAVLRMSLPSNILIGFMSFLLRCVVQIAVNLQQNRYSTKSRQNISFTADWLLSEILSLRLGAALVLWVCHDLAEYLFYYRLSIYQICSKPQAKATTGEMMEMTGDNYDVTSLMYNILETNLLIVDNKKSIYWMIPNIIFFL